MRKSMGFQMVEMTPENAAKFLRQAAETTARSSQDWDNFEAITKGFISDAYKAGESTHNANARADERERCAKIAELPSVLSGGSNGDRRAEIIAACIRNLGDDDD